MRKMLNNAVDGQSGVIYVYENSWQILAREVTIKKYGIDDDDSDDDGSGGGEVPIKVHMHLNLPPQNETVIC